MNKVCEDCAKDYENAEANLKKEIKALHAEVDQLANGIFKCVKDPCWQKHLLHNGSDAPITC